MTNTIKVLETAKDAYSRGTFSVNEPFRAIAYGIRKETCDQSNDTFFALFDHISDLVAQAIRDQKPTNRGEVVDCFDSVMNEIKVH